MVIKEEILAKINDLLKELSQRYETISDNDNLNLLEYELFEADAVYFSEYVKVLRKFHTESSVEKQEDTSEAIAKDEIDEPEQAETQVDEPEGSDVDVSDNEFVEEESPEETAPAVSNEGESSYNSEEKGGGVFESNLIIEDDKVVAEEDEVVLENEEFNEPSEDQPRIISETKSTIEEEVVIEQEVVIAEKEFSFKVEADKIEDKKEVEEEKEKQDEPMSLAQSYSASKPQSLNDRISALRQSQSAGSGTKPTLQRTTDIKSSINLNDKLLFIKDLFNGYSLAYSEAIELLNRYESFEEADLFLRNNYAEKNNWESKKDTVEKLYAVLRKRYG